MQDNKREQDAQTGSPNPTLGSPGSQVADYGNPTGGSANNGAANAQQPQAQQPDQAQRGGEGEETMGNP